MIRLIYISRVLLTESNAYAELDDIVSLGRSRNEYLSVTGALIYAISHFVQILEGETAAVDELMKSIIADKRHCEVNVIERVSIERRSFGNWSLAYSGNASFIQKALDSCISDPDDRLAIRKLHDVFVQFAEAGGVFH